MAVPKRFLDRLLPERSKLIFYFPNPEEGDSYTTVRLPFYENPQISESKRARYQDHQLISRSSNLYTYLGADSRKLDLSFNLTLPHIQEEYANKNVINRSVTLKAKGTRQDRQLFLNPRGASKSLGNKASFKLAEDYRDSQRARVAESAFNPETSKIDFSRIGFIAESALLAPTTGQVQRRKYASLINYWVNIIRSTVVNNSNNPLYGPPIIRLRHGIMYQDVPCICKDYSISIDETAGYDAETLLPRLIKVRMNLEEFRAGNFGEFNPNSNNPFERDNLAGWEAVLEHETADPGVEYLDPAFKETSVFNVPNWTDTQFNKLGKLAEDNQGFIFS